MGAISRSTDPSCVLAFDLLVDRICGFVGSYYVSLHGKVDALVFAGGIGEKSDVLRSRVVQQCACLGFAVDEQRNASAADADGVVTDVGARTGADGVKHRVLVVRTDEQLEMARATAADAELWK